MPPTEYQRPDPDALLSRVQEQERRAARGKLRIYFGASAGVGKTFAMLNAGRKLKAEGHDVVVGIVETHGRKETEALLEGLDMLPRKTIEYRGRTLTEFDIDAALERGPALILVDELAHSNAPGSRHPKRWQDVDELLSAGIDVFTTVNVQHLESLNDVVGGITGIRVAETLPDTVFDEADEVVLVDIPAEELLTRLAEGKVYQAQQAERASRNFFRKGNLIALRELALRRTADRIEDDVQAYRVEKSISDIWKTDSDLLACVGPHPGAEHVIRSTARLASQLNAQWHAVYVETPQLQRLPSQQRERILKVLKLAQDLGATTAVLSGNDVAQVVVDYARSHNFSRILLGREQSRWPWRAAHIKRIKRIAALAPDIDLIETGRRTAGEAAEAEPLGASDVSQGDAESELRERKPRHWRYVWTVGSCVFTTLVTTPMRGYFDLANIVMLFLLTVMLIAVRFGRGPAVLSAFLNVAAFDFFIVPPRFTFAVSDLQYLVVFAVMLAVGLIAGQLTGGLRFQARIASAREGRARALYEFARELSGALQTEQIFETTRNFVQRTFRARAVLLLPDDAGRLQFPGAVKGEADRAPQLSVLDMGIAQWAFDRATAAGMGTDTLPGSSFFYLPLVAPMRTRGVLAIQPESRRWILIPEQRRQLDTFATLAAIALERVHYIEVAQNALVSMESERLRNSLLAALSHDLRTPLTSLIGLSESLTRSRPPLAPSQQELAKALHEEAIRMGNLVANLLDMARIQSGEVRLNLQWQHFEEVVGSALRACQSLLAKHQVETKLARDLPLVQFDAVLIERVLCNLIENATKYTPPGSRIVITAQAGGENLEASVYDNGPGLPAGQEETVFEKFTRGERESATPGVGLGLAICRAIIDAHHGSIHAGHSPEGGAAIVFSLPLGIPPALPDADEPETSIVNHAS
ncbi:MAG TPA: two-component system sensor histidine kinase KdpD [Noviherbaspirillum sp.]|nr:two-component system sensor histidine kinase KdpD [Noviherbaspirillum sp.]